LIPEDSFDSGLLAELRALDSFRRRYSSEQPAAQLDAQDPDVQRLIEALAYSAVRTRQAVLRNLSETWRRLLGGYFQPLLRSLPAMAMMEAQVTARMTETTVLPAGTELRVSCQDGFVAGFQTLADLRIVPMLLERCDLLRGGSGFRLVLVFTSRLPRTESVGLLRLYVHYLDDYLAALSVHQQLRRHLQRAFVVYDAPVHDRSDGPACRVEFGRTFDEPYEADEQNPLAAVRGFFHFPEQELLINVSVPPPRQPWTRLSLCFDLDPAWPRNPPLYREVFRPFVVPVRNLRRAPAQIIECDGTQDAHPIRFVHADPSYALHSVHGVYKMTDDGLDPIPPTTLSDSTPSYEVETGDPAAGRGSAGAAWLLLRLPHALLEPVRITVDASWQQPSLGEHLAGRLSVSLPDRSLLGLDLGLVGPVRKGIEARTGRDAAALLRLLSLKMKSVLSAADLAALFAMLESVDQGPYRGFLGRVREIAVELTPDETLAGAGIRHTYHLLVPQPKAEEEPLWEMFCRELQRLLDAWDYEGRAEVLRHSDPTHMPAESLRRR
jgi:type VI secretion system protein ImpG